MRFLSISEDQSDSDPDMDEPFEMKRPTLLRQLQVILDEYPDDAQILRVNCL